MAMVLFNSLLTSLCFLSTLCYQVSASDLFGNWTIEPGIPFITHDDDHETFILSLQWTVGSSAANVKQTYLKTNCVGDIEGEVLDIFPFNFDSDLGTLNRTVHIIKNFLFQSPMTDYDYLEDKSIGNLRFCVKTELLSEDGISVSFRRDNINVRFVLPKFSMFDTIHTKSVKPFEALVLDIDDSMYGVDVCFCEIKSWDCLTGDLPPLRIDSFISMCLQPNHTDVVIGNFNVKFTIEDVGVFSTVSFGDNGPTTTGLSVLMGNETAYKAITKTVSAIFFHPGKSVLVGGDVNMVFREGERRQLSKKVMPPIRSLQATKESAGTVKYSMSIPIESLIRSESRGNMMNLITKSILIVGGSAFLCIVYILFKKNQK